MGSEMAATLTIDDHEYEGVGGLVRMGLNDEGRNIYEGSFQTHYPGFGIKDTDPNREEKIMAKFPRGTEAIFEGLRDDQRARSRVRIGNRETDKYTTSPSGEPASTWHILRIEEIELMAYL